MLRLMLLLPLSPLGGLIVIVKVTVKLTIILSIILTIILSIILTASVTICFKGGKKIAAFSRLFWVNSKDSKDSKGSLVGYVLLLLAYFIVCLALQLRCQPTRHSVPSRSYSTAVGLLSVVVAYKLHLALR